MDYDYLAIILKRQIIKNDDKDIREDLKKMFNNGFESIKKEHKKE